VTSPEHFQAKWIPVRVKKMRQGKNPEHFQGKWVPVRVKKMRQGKNQEYGWCTKAMGKVPL
jgi:hypothetical protein